LDQHIPKPTVGVACAGGEKRGWKPTRKKCVNGGSPTENPQSRQWWIWVGICFSLYRLTDLFSLQGYEVD
jgi:hypothetical protein